MFPHLFKSRVVWEVGTLEAVIAALPRTPKQRRHLRRSWRKQQLSKARLTNWTKPACKVRDIDGNDRKPTEDEIRSANALLRQREAGGD